MAKKFYVTTPIYYPNDVLHLGHAYTTIAADVIARFHRLKKEDVFFLTGTDEHGKKIQTVAENKGKKPKQFVDALVSQIKEDFGKLNLTYDRFIRTTDKDHEKVVQDILKKVYAKGDIYLGEYEGFYCVACEQYYTEKDLENGNCKIHGKKVELLKEESYFFKLSKYQKKLLEHYKKNKDFILPLHRRKEILNRVEKGLQDLSISRKSFDWGIPIPFDKKHVTYVWFDALTNYYSATRKKGKEKFWPADLHLVGKEILWFHSVIWPAMLLSAGIKLPKTIFAHGWWTIDGEKISKTTGNVIGIDELVSIAGLDSARYFLLREIPFGEDGDFSKEKLIQRHNDELANKLGNLVSRVSALAEKYGCKKDARYRVPNIPKEGLSEVDERIEKFQFDRALAAIFIFTDALNKWIQEKKPWEIQNEVEKKAVIYNLREGILQIAILLSPFMPETSEKIAKIFKTDKIKKAEPLFRKIENG